MDPLILVLLVTVGLGLIRFVLLSVLLRTPDPVFVFLIVNLITTIIVSLATGLALTLLLLTYLGMAIWFACIPIETKTTV